MMPDTYTQEQIDEAKELARQVDYEEVCGTFNGQPMFRDNTSPIQKALVLLLSALSTAERERDENKSKAEQYYKDWYASKAEFGDITAKLRDRVRTAEARVAELEAIPDRLRKLDISLCPEPHGEWSLLDGEKEIAFFGDSIESVIRQAEAAIVGKKEGCTMMFEVIVTNKLLGNSRRIMSIEQIEKFNVCALACAKAAAIDGNPHTMGMWTVKLAEEDLEGNDA